MKSIRVALMLLLLAAAMTNGSAQLSETTKDTAANSNRRGLSASQSANTAPTTRTDEELLKDFSPYAPTEVTLIIPGVAFGDKAVERLLGAIKNEASVRQASLYYKNRLAVITVTQKNPASFEFWNAIPADIKTMFPTKKTGTRSRLLAFDPEQKSPLQGNAPEVTVRSATDQTTSPNRRGQAAPITPVKITNTNTTGDNQAAQNSKPTVQQNSNTVPSNGKKNADEERWPDDPYVAALKKAKLGKPGAFVEFKKDGVLHQYNESVVAVLPASFLGTDKSGLGVQFIDLRKNAMIVLFVSGGDKEILPGKYQFASGAKEIFIDSEEALTEAQVMFSFEEGDPKTKQTVANAVASSITNQTFRQNIVSGYVDFTHIQLTEELIRVEGTFRFETKESKDRHGKIYPATVITEGRFVAIPGGIPVSY